MGPRAKPCLMKLKKGLTERRIENPAYRSEREIV
jgi:hypothetical protein